MSVTWLVVTKADLMVIGYSVTQSKFEIASFHASSDVRYAQHASVRS